MEQGGQGTGTIVRVGMNVLGAKRLYRQVVSEPEPGRVLVETDPDAGVVTTFTVDPVNGSQHACVTITTEVKASPGLLGWIERIVNPPLTRHIFRQELRQLADYLRHHPAQQ